MSPDLSKVEKSFVKKLKDAFGRDEVKETIKKLKNAAQVSVAASTQAAGRSVYKVRMGLIPLLSKISLAIFVFLLVIFYGSLIFSMGINASLSLLDLIKDPLNLNPVFMGWLSLFMTLAVIIAAVVYSIPVFSIEAKNKFVKLALLLPLFLIFFGILLWANLYDRTYTFDENARVAMNTTTSSWSQIWEDLKCNMNQECLQRKLASNVAETAAAAEFSIRPHTASRPEFYSAADLLRGMQLYYTIISKDRINLLNYSCHYRNQANEYILLSSGTFSEGDRTIVTGSEGIVLEVKCENMNIIELEEGVTRDYPIIVRLNYEIEGTYTQTIPVIDYNSFILSEGLNPQEQYSYFFLKRKLDEITRNDKSFIQTNNALTVDSSILKHNLPLLIGDGVEREFSFPLEIRRNNANNIGKLITSRVTDFTLPQNVLTLNDQPLSEIVGTTLEARNDRIVTNIYLREVESSSGNNFDTLTSAQFMYLTQMEIKILSQFEHEQRFMLTINNEGSSRTQTGSVTDSEIDSDGISETQTTGSLPSSTNQDSSVSGIISSESEQLRNQLLLEMQQVNSQMTIINQRITELEQQDSLIQTEVEELDFLKDELSDLAIEYTSLINQVNSLS